MTTTFTINGQPYTANLTNLPPDITLNTFIREHAQLTATKFMCQEGGCGVCICVLRDGQRSWAVNSCLTLLNSCSQLEIVTSEGLGNKSSGYHPIQKRLAQLNGSQCGYCSPGMVMNMHGLLESRGGQVTMAEVENAFGGNICRCTGYRPILDAMKSFAADSNIQLPAECVADIEDLNMRTRKQCPKTGERCAGNCVRANLIYDDGSQWHWPKTLVELFEALEKVGEQEEFMLVAGNTAHGVYRRSPDTPRHFIDVRGVGELQEHSSDAQQLKLGANLSLSQAMDIVKDTSQQAGFEYLQQLWQHLDLIANVPVRNSGTLAGNIAIKKQHPEFPSDVHISFEALNVHVLASINAKEQQQMPLADYLSSKDRKLVLKAFLLPAYPKEKYIYESYKIMPRAQNAHAYVNAAFLLELGAESQVKSARICFGGIRPDFVHATAIEELLLGRNPFDNAWLEQAFAKLSTLLQPDEVLPDASAAYRVSLAGGLLYKFLLKHAPAASVNDAFRSGGKLLERALSSGTQVYQTKKENYPVTQAVQKVESMIQCSGEATYMNDVLTTTNTLHCAFVGATKVGASIEQIDTTEALRQPGVIAFYSAKDVPGSNTFTDPTFGYEPEEIFCATRVRYYEQPVGLVVALSAERAQRAAKLVKITYSQSQLLRPVLPSLSDVLDMSPLDSSLIIQMAKPKPGKFQCSAEPDVSVRGVFQMGLQYHFTMEPQTTVAVPFEDGLKIYSATQWMDQTQSVIAHMLQLKAKDVQLQVRRLGGGYGSKITRGNQVACAASLAAHKLNRPVRFIQSLESMMDANGKRWACRSDYQFHALNSGKIVGLQNDFYEDAGWNTNENPISGHSTSTAANCYDFNDANHKINGNAVLTDAPSSTWCRAPGSVEGIAMIENIVEHVAFVVERDPAEVRLLNIAKGNKMAELLPQFLKSREYRARRQEIENHNDNNRWTKRGLGLAIMDYPIFYFGQYAATVAIYHVDGTVVVTHGGIEMGQGMNTKVAQVAAFTLGIELSYIKIESSDTINGANSMVTGGAVGSESLCFAVRKACETLNKRLQPMKKKGVGWEETVQAAFAASINLIASDHYKEGDMQNYHVDRAGRADRQQSDPACRSTEDAGESLSPYIDIGQIEGAFVMCLGYWLSELLIYERQTGRLLTNRTWNYKPPGAKDIPIDFRVEMVQNPQASSAGFMRSKATGEPPCCLAVSVIFALQQALQSARKDAGLPREWVRLGAPTTPEILLLNAGHDIKSFRLK
ncbi:GH19389 [Drosophila grimshawi]|uniref:GH19389 n=1 Tax=Drosophila grimshawi TaxID=7222 RepID=B4JFT8_DROGR|nr:GH19389 [Drosophila grimshawi]